MRHATNICSLVLLLGCPVAADTINVPGDQPTITQAVAAAGPGDTVYIEPGVYPEGNIYIGSPDLTITGAVHDDGSPAVTIDGSGVNDILIAIGVVGSNGATVENIVFTGSLGNSLWIYHMDPVIRNCVFTGITSEWSGAAIWSSDSEALIEDCRFVGNDAGESGNILFNKSISGDNPGLLARRCSFEDNQGYAIAQIQFTVAEFQDCTFRNNTATGVVSTFGTGGLVSVSESLFCENDGGADINGPWNDGGGNRFEDVCPVDCLGDVTGDGSVNVTDLLEVISGWGDPYDVGDLLDVIAGWASCD